LKRIVDMNPDIYGIVFCRTRQETKEVAEKLMRDGYNADALHGDLSQAQRDTVMNKFRIRNLQILVATDVAARGLDVSDLTHVINYNLPDDVEVYTHRSGRTGRANKKGVSVSIIHTRERNRIREIERMIKKEFKQMPVPNGMDICKRQLFHLIDKMEHVTVNDEQISPFMEQIFSKLQYLSKEDLLTRFVSLEFNRFLEYYKDAPDINVVEKSRENKNDREERENRGRRDRNENSSHGGKFKRGQKFRLKMSIGSLQNANPRMILGIINDTTNDKSISVGNIEITNKFTFFDIFADQVEQVLQAFEERGRLKVVVVEEYSSDDRGGKRYDRKEKSEKRNYRSGKSERSNREISKRGSNSDKPWRNRR
ncbi:MAG: helicase-related protein, partial [Bacteroidota bacterium]|nr:helicase-related protein [Bacteroidota bacterium]